MGQSYSLDELLAYPEWKEFFQLSGCEWAIPIVAGNQDVNKTLRTLLQEVKLRAI